MTDIVVGSGPSGYAAIRARLALGRKVTLIDVGHQLEPAQRKTRDALARREPRDWADDDLEVFRRSQEENPGGISRFGSAFAVRPMQDVVQPSGAGLVLRSSHALGGLSNVWGSAVLPWSAGDMKGWPISADDMAPHYQAVSRFMPVAGSPDHFGALFPVSEIAFSHSLPSNPQANGLIRRLGRLSDGQAQAQVWTGPAWQAAGPGCRSCGLCLYGCPYGVIYSTGPDVETLVNSGALTHIRGEVIGVSETGGGVEIALSGRDEKVTGDRLFIAAGVLETARILFESRPEIAERGVTLRESRHFFTPFLQSGPAGKPDRDPHHTLVQAFVEFRRPEISPWLVHTQVFGWNDFYAREMSARYGRGIGAIAPLFQWLSRRLFAAQTFLHSEHCHGIHLRPGHDASRRLVADLAVSPDFDRKVRAARDFLASYMRRGGLHALKAAGRLDPPGASFHTGATLPMSAAPGTCETDVLGRPSGAQRIHIVDASVLPAIPASTITFPVMANAHRIAVLA